MHILTPDTSAYRSVYFNSVSTMLALVTGQGIGRSACGWPDTDATRPTEIVPTICRSRTESLLYSYHKTPKPIYTLIDIPSYTLAVQCIGKNNNMFIQIMLSLNSCHNKV
jgi:hypothetical protein